MNTTEQSVLQFVREQDVRFVKLSFCDIFGNLQNISISSKELPRAFESGISFDASSIRGFLYSDRSDLFLFPDTTTLSLLPWRPAQGRVVRMFCSIRKPDGTPFEGDSRGYLARTVESAYRKGYDFSIGPECEFYLFKCDPEGNPTRTPIDTGTYFDAAPLDRGEDIRRNICLTLEEMGFYTERSHHESGPGQNEIDFRYGEPMEAADNTILFKNVVRMMADRNGMFASFLPKPISDESGSGLHVNMSLREPDTEKHEQMIAGILSHISEITAFANPLANSYERLGSWEAPIHIGWGDSNRSLLVRIPAAKGAYTRFEVRSPDPSCNPYLTYALLIRAAVEGLEKQMEMPAYAGNDLPGNLGEALAIARKSEFLRDAMDERMLGGYLEAKESEWEAYQESGDSVSRYFLTT